MMTFPEVTVAGAGIKGAGTLFIYFFRLSLPQLSISGVAAVTAPVPFHCRHQELKKKMKLQKKKLQYYAADAVAALFREKGKGCELTPTHTHTLIRRKQLRLK